MVFKSITKSTYLAEALEALRAAKRVDTVDQLMEIYTINQNSTHSRQTCWNEIRKRYLTIKEGRIIKTPLLKIIDFSGEKEYKGKKLKSPKNKFIRPTSDRVKEAVFNILGSKVPDSLFLDLFAGTGSMGIEALSRGASRAVFVDNNNSSLKIIRENLEMTKLLNKSEIINDSCLNCVNKLKHKYEKFDIIYMDPPYNMENIIRLLEIVTNQGLLDREGVLLLEHSKN